MSWPRRLPMKLSAELLFWLIRRLDRRTLYLLDENLLWWRIHGREKWYMPPGHRDQ